MTTTFVLLVTCAGMALSANASAQLKDCTAISSTTSYKIVLDDFVVPDSDAGSHPAVTTALNDLRFHIEGQSEKLNQSAQELKRTLNVPLVFVRCDGRKPEISGQDFTNARATILSDARVVVEVWGKVTVREGTASGQPVAHASVGFVMPPVQNYLRADSVPALHVLDYPRSTGVTINEELESLPELSAFALAGLAVKAAKAEKYDLASLAYTKAMAGIDEALALNSHGELRELRTFLILAACRLRNQARDSPDDKYHGGLKLTPHESCGAPP